MPSQKISIPKRKLKGELRSSKNHSILIILCHGYNSSANNPMLVILAEDLYSSGYSTFSFTFSKGINAVDIKSQVEDILEVIDHFESYKEIVLLGHSFAALSVSIAVNKTSKVVGIITLNGFFGRRKLGKKYKRGYIKFRAAALIVPTQRSILKYFKSELEPSSIKVPVLVIHSEADESVYIDQSNYFYKNLTTIKQFITIKNASHNLNDSKDRKLVSQKIVNWLQSL
jgi:pimeloyl-ACP methyl ester carboxylesterase